MAGYELCGCTTDGTQFCAVHEPKDIIKAPCGCQGIINDEGDYVTTMSCADHLGGFVDARTDAQIAKMDVTNPKDLVGAKKVSISKLPAVAILHASHAMMHGANIYGSYNWRSKKVQAEIYIDAALRHITSWNEREECATDSNVHHLGHAMACLAILLDAQETGNLVDNRPPQSKAYPEALARLNEVIARTK
jgi:hypothetical protein